MKTIAPTERMHILHPSLLNPANPISINVIGGGGTGSHLIPYLDRLDYALVALGYAGLHVNLFDKDQIEEPNFGRSKFNHNYKGINKAVALISHTNRTSGTNWKAIPEWFDEFDANQIPENRLANITISCVDTVKARYSIAKILQKGSQTFSYQRIKPLYWMDFGNSKYTGQAIFSTVCDIKQPESKLFETVSSLPSVTQEYADYLKQSETEDSKPSCSVFDSLNDQSLFINSALANYGGAFLSELLTKGMTPHRGFFLNIENFRSQPIMV